MYLFCQDDCCNRITSMKNWKNGTVVKPHIVIKYLEVSVYRQVGQLLNICPPQLLFCFRFIDKAYFILGCQQFSYIGKNYPVVILFQTISNTALRSLFSLFVFFYLLLHTELTGLFFIKKLYFHKPIFPLYEIWDCEISCRKKETKRNK